MYLCLAFSISLSLRSLNERARSFADFEKDEAAVFREELEPTLADRDAEESPEEELLG